MILNCPKGEFTIAELELANPKVDVSAIRVTLAEAISNGGVVVINKDENQGELRRPFVYRKK